MTYQNGPPFMVRGRRRRGEASIIFGRVRIQRRILLFLCCETHNRLIIWPVDVIRNSADHFEIRSNLYSISFCCQFLFFHVIRWPRVQELTKTSTFFSVHLINLTFQVKVISKTTQKKDHKSKWYRDNNFDVQFWNVWLFDRFPWNAKCSQEFCGRTEKLKH